MKKFFVILLTVGFAYVLAFYSIEGNEDKELFDLQRLAFKLGFQVDTNDFYQVLDAGVDEYFDYDYDKSVRYLKRALVLDSTSFEAAHYLGMIYVGWNDTVAALPYFSKAVANSSSYIEDYDLSSRFLINHGKADSAVVILSKGVEILSAPTTLHVLLGRAHINLQKYDLAVASLTTALSYEETREAYLLRASAYKLLGKDDLAATDLEKAESFSDYSDNTVVDTETEDYNAKGIEYYNSGDYDNALIYFLKATRATPDMKEGWYNTGLIYDNKEMDDSAIYYYNKSLEIDNQYSYAYNNLGLIYYHRNDYDKALEYYDKILDYDTEYSNAYYLKGLVYYDMSRYDACVEQMNLARNKGCEIKDLYYYLAVSYDKQEKSSLAKVYYKRYIDSSPAEGESLDYATQRYNEL